MNYKNEEYTSIDSGYVLYIKDTMHSMLELLRQLKILEKTVKFNNSVEYIDANIQRCKDCLEFIEESKIEYVDDEQ